MSSVVANVNYVPNSHALYVNSIKATGPNASVMICARAGSRLLPAELPAALCVLPAVAVLASKVEEAVALVGVSEEVSVSSRVDLVFNW